MKLRERLEICEKFVEGSEIGDCVTAMCRAIRQLLGISADHEAELVLLACEHMCRNYVDYLRTNKDDYEEYRDFPVEVFKYFTGGANKLTEEEYNR